MKAQLGLEACVFQLQLLTWKAHLQLPALTLPSSSCHSLPEHGALWEERLITITTRPGSLLFSLSEDPSTPRRPPVLSRCHSCSGDQCCCRGFYLFGRRATNTAYQRELSTPLTLTGAFTDTSDNGSTILQTNFCLWLLNETQGLSERKMIQRCQLAADV